MNIESRLKLVTKLIEYDGNPRQIVDELQVFCWDCDVELINLKPAHLNKVLDLYVSGKITSNDIYNWANFVELREDIGFEEDSEDIVQEAIFWLANPEINYPITLESAKEIKTKLNNIKD